MRELKIPEISLGIRDRTILAVPADSYVPTARAAASRYEHGGTSRGCGICRTWLLADFMRYQVHAAIPAIAVHA